MAKSGVTLRRIQNHWSRRCSGLAFLLVLSMLAGVACGQEPADEQTAAQQANLAEIIRAVKQNEKLFANLETEMYRERQLMIEENPKQWTATRVEERSRTVRQGKLYYFEEEETQTRLAGEVVTLKRVTAYDGEKTRSVLYDNSATICDVRRESDRSAPPHTWALSHWHVHFPLSILLQGTKAIRKHPNVHRFARPAGQLYEFRRFEVEFAGEEAVKGLNCVKIRCRQWKYPRRGEPVERMLWLAPERNYLCLKSESNYLGPNKQPAEVSQVDAFYQLKEELWVPARVIVQRYDEDALEQGMEVLEWKEKLLFQKPELNPEYPAGFFSDVEIPEDLPVYRIVDGRLDQDHLLDREPTADSKEKVEELIEAIRREEERYQNLNLDVTETYRYDVLHWRVTAIGNRVDTRYSIDVIRSVQSDGKLLVAVDYDTGTTKDERIQRQSVSVFDGTWVRYASHTTDQTRQYQRASLSRGYPPAISLPRPHKAIFCSQSTTPFSRYLASPWSDERFGRVHTFDYLGEHEQQGLRCVVLREEIYKQGWEADKTHRLYWLAIDRNYLPIRCEIYDLSVNRQLPRWIAEVTDLRELAPGIWYPYQARVRGFRDTEPGGLGVGRMRIDYTKSYSVEEAVVDPEIDAGRFDELEFPEGTKGYIRDERGDGVEGFEMTRTEVLNISEERYLELINKANEKERENVRQPRETQAAIGQSAPEITNVTWVNHPEISLAKSKGKVVVLHFWALWCEDAVQELKPLTDWYAGQQQDSSSDVLVIGVHSTGRRSSEVKTVLEEHDVTYPVLIDSRSDRSRSLGQLSNEFGVYCVPTTCVIDADGKIAAYGELKEMLAKAGELVGNAKQRDKDKEPPQDEE